MNNKIRIEVELEGKDAKDFLWFILDSIRKRELIEIVEPGEIVIEDVEPAEEEEAKEKVRKTAERESEIEEAQDTYVIAEKVLGHRKGRIPKRQVNAIKYIYAKGGIVPLKELTQVFDMATPYRLVKKKAAYITNIGREKVIALEDHVKDFLGKLYGEKHEG